MNSRRSYIGSICFLLGAGSLVGACGATMMQAQPEAVGLSVVAILLAFAGEWFVS